MASRHKPEAAKEGGGPSAHDQDERIRTGLVNAKDICKRACPIDSTIEFGSASASFCMSVEGWACQVPFLFSKARQLFCKFEEVVRDA
jgi:hypothetical protein